MYKKSSAGNEMALQGLSVVFDCRHPRRRREEVITTDDDFTGCVGLDRGRRKRGPSD